MKPRTSIHINFKAVVKRKTSNSYQGRPMTTNIDFSKSYIGYLHKRTNIQKKQNPKIMHVALFTPNLNYSPPKHTYTTQMERTIKTQKKNPLVSKQWNGNSTIVKW